MFSLAPTRTLRHADVMVHGSRAAVVARLAHLRDAAPSLIATLRHAHQHHEVETSAVYSPDLPRITFHEWDADHWFVIADGWCMLGEVQYTERSYRVSHTLECRGATYSFASLHLAAQYFEEYAEALAA